VNIGKGVEGSLHVANRRFVAVGSEKGVNHDKVRMSRVSKPINATNETLICFFFQLFRAEEAFSTEQWAAELIDMPERYGVAVGV
jgi:hypothetical protein